MAELDPSQPIGTVGFVGLGNMGRPMAARLAGDFELLVYDLNGEAVERFVAEHAGAAGPGPDELAARADALVTMLPDGEAVRRALLEDGGLAASLRPGSIVIDMSSSDPADTVATGEGLHAKGVAMVDAPVSGGVRGAEAGTLAIMAGGEAADVARCRPLLERLGAHVFHMGALGSGHAMKALNNYVSAAGFAAAVEAILAGRRYGLDPDRMVDALNASTGRNASTESKLREQVLSGRFASGFSIGLMAKDLRTATGIAAAMGLEAPLAEACAALWAEAAASTGPTADHTELIRRWD